MNRRTFLATASALALLPAVAHAGIGIAYTPGLVDQLLAEGKTVFVDFYTDWCSTCAAQERTINALLKENPAYEQSVTHTVFVHCALVSVKFKVKQSTW